MSDLRSAKGLSYQNSNNEELGSTSAAGGNVFDRSKECFGPLKLTISSKTQETSRSKSGGSYGDMTAPGGPA